jgi:hypothetical protein
MKNGLPQGSLPLPWGSPSDQLFCLTLKKPSSFSVFSIAG